MQNPRVGILKPKLKESFLHFKIELATSAREILVQTPDHRVVRAVACGLHIVPSNT